MTNDVAVHVEVRHSSGRARPRGRESASPQHAMHELFEAQVARAPERIALQFANETLTYRELNARANRIARRLRAHGVGPDTLVGILLDRSVTMVAALLGILKAGGAYVPLDPMYPVDRLEFMLEDSAAPVLVTQPSLASLLRTSAAIVELEGSSEGDDANLASNVDAENLAYVIYTSGSTGKPKGVQIPHRALVNFLDTMREAPGLEEHDSIFAVTTLSFDIAGLELWLPLTTGARIELVSREVAADGRRLADALSRSDATVMQATPATWRMLLEAGWKGNPRLKILCGGEAMPRDLASALLSRCGELWNMYGPTETTIWSTIHRVTDVSGSGANVPIGKAIANTQLYVLDAQQQPVALGEEGELYIGGDGVARGYLHRPELTAQRFLTDPFGAPGARMYRTGDAVRQLPDGSIEYLDRLDNQVKIRGYRIELGEIESALRKHDGVADAVVIARDDMPGGKALVAYCIARGTAPSAAALREHLRASLPEYMVPSHFAPIDAFPLTPNGKIDRKALPRPQHIDREDDDFVAPRGEVEQKLAAIWSDVLNVRRIGARDHFFELGGDSFLAVRLCMRIQETFGRDLPLITLLTAPTLEALARVIESDAKVTWSPLVPLQTRGNKRPLFVVHGVGGNVLNYRPLSHHLGNDQPFYALQARGIDGTFTPLTSIEKMARLYVEEIRRVQPRGPYLLAGLSFGGVVAFEMAQQLSALGEKTSMIALFDSAPVGYSRLVRQEQFGDPTDTLTRRLKVHANELMRSPDRVTYFRKKVRRVWRKLVYRAWQTTFALYEKLKRPLPRALQDVQQANYLALRNYKPQVYAGEVVFFFAEKEPAGFTREKQHGWSILAARGVQSVQVPGDHLTMLDEPHVRDLAEKLRECLAARA